MRWRRLTRVDDVPSRPHPSLSAQHHSNKRLSVHSSGTLSTAAHESELSPIPLNMLVRIRSKDGNFRFPLEPTDDVALLIAKVLETAPNADPSTLTLSNQPRGGEMSAESLKGTSLGDLGIAHGHLLYAAYQEVASSAASAPSANNGSASSNAASGAGASIAIPGMGVASGSAATGGKREKKPWEDVQEEKVDVYWQAQDGKIPRSRDAKMCRHGDKAMCDYCMPLEPYDVAYQAEHQIKHLSFNAYLRKLDVATNKPGQSYIPPLEPANYTVQTPCPSGQHPSWPAGICTKCQPSAITLQSQPFRMVDHVEFASPRLIENLLAFWRATGAQRFGFLLGRYEPYPDVPMGVKAVVEAIHEPPQEGEVDGLTLGVPWEEQARVEALARKAGLHIVGQIYTDLTAADPTHEDKSKAGKVLCKRHKDSYFLSGCELLFAAQLQVANPNPSRFSVSGKFNSKFVTCVLSGTEDGGIDVSAYQASEQAMAMVTADMIEASVSPNIIRVCPSEGTRYVPEVFYRYKNAYKIDVKESAKPTFPVEYLIITLTHGFPNEPRPTFLSSNFPVENRPGLHDQDMGKALSIIAGAMGGRELLPLGFGGAKASLEGEEGKAREKLVEVLSDWHLLSFLETCGILDKDDMDVITNIAVTHDASDALDALLGRDNWQTIVAIAREHAPHASSAFGGAGAAPGASSASSRRASPPRSGAGSGASGKPDDPIVYGGNDDDSDIDIIDAIYDEDDDDGPTYDDDEMFEDAASTHSNNAAPAPATGSREQPQVVDDDHNGGKACGVCTFHNDHASGDCDMCGLPL